MLTEERQQAIASYINNHSICRVNELCKLTKSSESTIRRDLIELEKRGVIVVHVRCKIIHATLNSRLDLILMLIRSVKLLVLP